MGVQIILPSWQNTPGNLTLIPSGMNQVSSKHYGLAAKRSLFIGSLLMALFILTLGSMAGCTFKNVKAELATVPTEKYSVVWVGDIGDRCSVSFCHGSNLSVKRLLTSVDVQKVGEGTASLGIFRFLNPTLNFVG
jgi:hypothetical protein